MGVKFKKLPDADSARLLTACVKANSAAISAFEYFNDLHGKFVEDGKDWSTHIQTVLFAGKDDRYNELRKVEGDTRDAAIAILDSLAGEYPYLTHLRPMIGWHQFEGNFLKQKIENEWREAEIAAIRKDFESETASTYKELKALPRQSSLGDVPVGTSIVFFEGFEKAMFKVVGKTPTGRFVDLQLVTTGDVLRMKGVCKSHPYSFVVIPADRVEYLEDLSHRWWTALQESGIDLAAIKKEGGR